MCGLSGIHKIKGLINHRDRAKASKMYDALYHRGRDGSSMKSINDQTIISHRLMNISSFDGSQPKRAGGWQIWLNGEIYSIDGLTIKLDDTEQLAEAFHKWGLQAITRINGMFVIIAHDGENTYIIRDRWGQKPMYYYETDEAIYFASEVKALLKIVDTDIDPDSLREYFTIQNYLDDKTLWKGIKEMPKGSFMELDDNPRLASYHDHILSRDFEGSYEDATLIVRELLINGFTRQKYRGEDSLWLSGGIDSYLIAEIMKPAKAFSCIYSEKVFDERGNIEKMKEIDQYHLLIQEHHAHRLIPELDNLKMGPSYSNHRLAELTGRYSRVNYQGSGGDEIFMGYHWRYKSDPWQTNNKTHLNFEDVEERFNSKFSDQRKWDLDYFLPGILSIGDIISSHFHYEDRAPFLDNDLMGFVRTLPDEWLINKKILKDALNLPQYLIDSPKKGFTNPDAIYLPNVKIEGIYRDYIDINPDPSNPALLWCILSFENLLNQYK